MKADKRKDRPSSLRSQQICASCVPISNRVHSIIIIHSFKPIYFRFAESAYYVPPPRN